MARDGYLIVQPGSTDVIFGRWDLFMKQLVADDRAGPVRVVHQPNFFPSLNVMGLMRLGGKVAKATTKPLRFTGVDYDIAGNHAFRSAQVAAINGSKSLYLGGVVPKANRRSIALVSRPPSARSLSSSSSTIRSTAAFWKRHVRRAGHFASDLNDPLLEQSMVRYLAIVENSDWLTSGLMSGFRSVSLDLLDQLLEQESGTTSFIGLASGLEELTIEVLKVEKDASTRLVWRICQTCFHRCRVETSIRSGHVHCAWTCFKCGDGGTGTLNFEELLPLERIVPAYVPQVLLSDLSDAALVDAKCYLAYAGGLSHTLESRRMALQLGCVPAPEFSWDPQSLFSHLLPDNLSREVEAAWTRGKFSALWYGLIYGKRSLMSAVDEAVAR
jgi:hypothetical protein